MSTIKKYFRVKFILYKNNEPIATLFNSVKILNIEYMHEIHLDVHDSFKVEFINREYAGQDMYVGFEVKSVKEVLWSIYFGLHRKEC